MPKKSLKFRINKDGSVTQLDACGYGADCLSATGPIEALLGRADESTRQMTAEYEKTPEQVLYAT